jgi:hypothetical protein
MARIIVGSYLVQFPLGGYLSWVGQWLIGLKRLGHDAWFVERAAGPDSCFCVPRRTMTSDCTYGATVVSEFLGRFGLQQRWCFVDYRERYHGRSRADVEHAFRNADLFVDMGTHGAWQEEAAWARVRILVDGEPGYRQMLMEGDRASGLLTAPVYDRYYTVGLNVGTPACTAPSGGQAWRPIFDPVVMELFPAEAAPVDAPFTTIMSWQAHEPVEYEGTVYGQKDVEFTKFLDLPRRTAFPMELAIAGAGTPVESLQAHGWRLRDSHEMTRTFDSWGEYIRRSRGEFSVAKHVFVATNSGFFSDRSAAYLASGRPVVMQDTGFSAHLPCGRGLFAVRNADEAASAIAQIAGNYRLHSAAAREIAREYLDAPRVLGRLCAELGL